MDLRLVINGSSGMLASALIEHIINLNITIVLLTSKPLQLKSKYGRFNNVEVISSIDELKIGSSFIFLNTAFPRKNDGGELAEYLDKLDVLVDTIAKKGCYYFINISSQSVYSQKGEVIQNEEDKVLPGNLYGMAKFSSEKIVSIKSTQNNMRFVNIRLGSLINEDFDKRMVNRFYQKIKSGENLKIDDGPTKVSFLYLTDAAEALKKLIFYHTFYDLENLYNLGNNNYLSLEELAEECLKAGKEIGFGKQNIELKNTISEYNNTINSDRFYNQFHWSPNLDMKKIVKTIFARQV